MRGEGLFAFVGIGLVYGALAAGLVFLLKPFVERERQLIRRVLGVAGE